MFSRILSPQLLALDWLFFHFLAAKLSLSKHLHENVPLPGMSPSGNLASSGASWPHAGRKDSMGDWDPQEALLRGVCWQPWLRPQLEELRALTKEVPSNIEGQMANDSETRKIIHWSHKQTKVHSVIYQRPLFTTFPSRPLNHLILFIKHLPSYCSIEELDMSLKFLKGIMAFHHSTWRHWALAVPRTGDTAVTRQTGKTVWAKVLQQSHVRAFLTGYLSVYMALKLGLQW